MRQGNWKAVRLQVATNPNGPVALYDLATDPAETRDVAAKHSAKAKELSRLMQEAHVPSPLFPLGSE